MANAIQVIRVRSFATASLVAVGIGLAGCGAAATATSSGQAPAAAAATAAAAGPRSKADQVKAYEHVCSLFTAAEAQTAMGDAQVLATSPAPFDISSNSGVLGVGDSAACLYMIPITGDLAQFSQGNPGLPGFIVSVDTRLSVVWGSIKAGKDKVPISGLGDEAYWQPGLDGGGVVVGRKGSMYVFITRLVQEGAPADAQDREVTLARSIAAKM